jgi:dolichol kinase
VLIIGGIIAVFAKICFADTKRNRMRLLVLLNFGIWAVRPLYNPQFLSSSSGMIIVAIFLAASYYSKSLSIKKVN